MKQMEVAARQGRPFLDPQAIDWNLLKSFCAIADSGTMTSAARLLNISQSSLSRHVAELEELVGASLFERLPRGLSLTEAGAALLAPARQMLEAAQALCLSATGQHREIAGTVRITASEVMSAFVLPPILAELRFAHPAIQIELVASNAIDNLIEREADIAVRMVRPTQGGLIAKKICELPTGFYAHEAYLARRGAACTADTAHQFDWIGLDRSNLLIEGFRAAGWNIDRTFFSFRSDSQIVGWHAVLAGAGIGACLKRVAQGYPQLVQVMKEQPLPSLPVWLTAHRELRDSPRIRAVFEFLSRALAES